MENKNWRTKIGKKREKNELDWRIHLQSEFVEFAKESSLLSKVYDWNFWGGGVNNYSITLSQAIRDGLSISIRIMPGDNYKYYVSFAKAWNPNNIPQNEYKEKIGDTLDETLKYLHTYLIEHEYQREFKGERICVMGGAYDRYSLALKWAYEELEETKEIEKTKISV